MPFPGNKSCYRYNCVVASVDLKREGYQVDLVEARRLQNYLRSVAHRAWALHEWSQLVFDEDDGPLIILTEMSKRIWQSLPEQVREDALVEDNAAWATRKWNDAGIPIG